MLIGMALRTTCRSIHRSQRWIRSEILTVRSHKARFNPLPAASLPHLACFSLDAKNGRDDLTMYTKKENDVTLVAEYKAFLLRAQRDKTGSERKAHEKEQFNREYQAIMDEYWSIHSSTTPSPVIIEMLNCEIDNMRANPKSQLTLTSNEALESIKQLLIERDEIPSIDNLCELMKCTTLFDQTTNESTNMFRYLKERILMSVDDSKSIFHILSGISLISATVQNRISPNFISIARVVLDTIAVKLNLNTTEDDLKFTQTPDEMSRCISKFHFLGLHVSLQDDVCRCLDEVFVKRLVEMDKRAAKDPTCLFTSQNIVDILKGVENLGGALSTVVDVLSFVSRQLKEAHIRDEILHNPVYGLEILKTLRLKMTYQQSGQIFEIICSYFEEASEKTGKKLSLHNYSIILNLLRGTNNSSKDIQDSLRSIARMVDIGYPQDETLSKPLIIYLHYQ